MEYRGPQCQDKHLKFSGLRRQLPGMTNFDRLGFQILISDSKRQLALILQSGAYYIYVAQACVFTTKIVLCQLNSTALSVLPVSIHHLSTTITQVIHILIWRPLLDLRRRLPKLSLSIYAMERRAVQITLAELKDKAVCLADRERAILGELVEVRGLLKAGSQQITELTNQLAPVSSLPNEVLLMIFEEYRSQSHHKMHSSVLLSHVCSRWRHLSMIVSFPWTTIVFDEEYHPAEFYEAFLTRSKNSPLEIVVWCVEGSFDDLEWDEALDQLSPHIGRWKRVEIVVDEVCWVNAMLERIHQASAPLLQCINITCYDPSEADSDSHLASHTDCTPALSTLILSHNITFPSLRSFRTSTTLRLSYLADQVDFPSNHHFFELLRALTCLTTLSLRGELIQYSESDRLPIIHLPTLLSLEISPKMDDGSCSQRPIPEDYVSRICNSLFTPALESLVIHFTCPSVISHFSNTLQTQPSKYPRLKSFEITEGLSRDESTVRLIRALPSITHFTLVDGPADGILHALHVDALAVPSLKVDPLWPHLCKITICELEEEGHLLRELVLARLAIGFPIKNLQIPPFPVGGHKWLHSIDIHVLKKYANLELIS